MHSLGYEWDNRGNLADRVDGPTRECFGYDVLDRLDDAYTTTNATCDNSNRGSGANGYAHTYTHSPSGNITNVSGSNVPGGTGGYTYGTGSSLHQLLSSPAGTYSYDARGNQTGRTIGGTTTSAAFDALDRMVGLDAPGTTSDATFVYNADGARVMRSIGDSATYYVPGLFEKTVSGGTGGGGGGIVLAQTATTVLMVAGAATATLSDLTVKNRLESQGYSVTVVDDDTVNISQADTHDLVMITSTVQPANIAVLAGTTSPVISWEGWGHDSIDLAYWPYGETGGTHTQVVVNAGHDIAGSLSGTTTIQTVANKLSYGENLGSGAVVVATVPGVSTQAAVFAYDTGSQMRGRVAPNRRVGFMWDWNSASNTTTDGWELFDNAVVWALGTTGPPPTTTTTTSSTTTTTAPPPGSPININFGTLTVAGWDTDSGLAYTAARGYGWSMADGLSRQCYHRSFDPDPLIDSVCRADAYWSNGWVTSPGTWKIDVANGDYEIVMSIGDPQYNNTGYVHSVQAEGVTIHNGVQSTAPSIVNAPVTVTVADGKVDLSFTGGVKTHVQWITITPVGGGSTTTTTTAPPPPPPTPSTSYTKHYRFAGQTIATRIDGDINYVASDHLGSATATVNAATNAVSTARYFPYGATRSQTGTLATERTYTGQIDDGNGLKYYNARYYDPTARRFTQPDTVIPDPAHGQSYNRYSYVRNNPVNFVDPSGNEECRTGPDEVQVCWPEADRVPREGWTQEELDAQSGFDQAPKWVLCIVHCQRYTVGPGGVSFEGSSILGNPFWDLAYEAVAEPAMQHAAQISADCTGRGSWLSCGIAVSVFALTRGQGTAGTRIVTSARRPARLAPNGLPPLRQQYVDAVGGIDETVSAMRAAGSSAEDIARAAHAQRRAIGEQFKDLTPDPLRTQIFDRNVQRYGDPLGPSVDWLRDAGKSWDEIIESAARTGGQDLGF